MTIRTKPVTKEYEDGWERTFGGEERREPSVFLAFGGKIRVIVDPEMPECEAEFRTATEHVRVTGLGKLPEAE